MQDDFSTAPFDRIFAAERDRQRLVASAARGTSLADNEIPPVASDEVMQAFAGPSRLRRRHSDHRRRPRRRRSSDPDRSESHWLSEDEAMDANEAHQASRRADVADDLRGDEDSDSDLFDAGTKEALLAGKLRLPPSLTNGHLHKLNNRPVRLPEAGDGATTPPLPATAALLDLMQVALECPACRDIMVNPVTLACGHAVCSSCTSVTATRSVPTTPAALPHVQPMQRRLSTSSGRSGSLTSSILPTWLHLGRWNQSGEGDAQSSPSSNETPPTAGIFGRASGSPKASTCDSPHRPLCPRAGCQEAAKAGPSPHVDVVLQKLVALFISEAPDKAPLSERFRQLSTRHIGGKARRTSSDSLVSSESPILETGKRIKIRKEGAVKRMRLPTTSLTVPEDAMEEDGGDSISSASMPASAFANDVLSELECQVCAYTIVSPLTTPCGHTFCRRCLMRSLDHSDRCPLCRCDLPPYAFFANHPSNGPLLTLLESVEGFKTITEERVTQQAGESVVSLRAAPIFICSLSFPKLPTFLHVFEPRYRLMMRRAMESDRRFGMILPQRPGRTGMFEYGTMLEIRNIQMLPDGRSVVETVGVYRFKVSESGMRDGYNTAAIERIDDIPPEQESELERAELKKLLAEPEPVAREGLSADDLLRQQIDRFSTEQLMSMCAEFFEKLRNGSSGAPWLYQRLNNTFGPMPDNAADASYWLASVLPIDDYQKAQLLPVTSPRLRLRLVVFWIQQMKGKWWFGSPSCSIMSSLPRPLTIAASVTVVGCLGYCLWFDHQRRHNPDFRRKLERQRQQASRAQRVEAQKQRSAAVDTLRRALDAIEGEPVPGGSPEEKENYFLEQVAIGEQLVARGPDFYVPAAVQFYKALKVYPAPHELMVIYQKTQPPAVFSLVMDCLSRGENQTPRRKRGMTDGPIIEEIDSTPSSPSRSKKNSSTGSDASSPNGAYIKVSADD